MRLIILVSILLLSCTYVSAQCAVGSSANPQKYTHKIKAINGISSATARVADYVEFKIIEPVYSSRGKEIFPKDTPIYGIVTRRKHRHFPFVGGNIELELEALSTWDGQQVEIAISRAQALVRQGQKMGKENKPCEYERGNCVAGRRNSEVAPVVTAVAGAGGAAVVAFAKDDQTRFIAASSFFTLAKDLGNLLNGTDATIAAGEIFNMHFTGPLTVCLRPEDKKTAQ